MVASATVAGLLPIDFWDSLEARSRFFLNFNGKKQNTKVKRLQTVGYSASSATQERNFVAPLGLAIEADGPPHSASLLLKAIV